VGSNPTRLAIGGQAPETDICNAQRRARSGGEMGHAYRAAMDPQHYTQRVVIATLLVGVLAISLLLVMLYPAPMHLLGVY
jgi:hypothetical protein